MGDVQTQDAVPAVVGIIPPDSEFEFEEVATSVEERFSRCYRNVAGKAEAYDEISLGWWLVLKRLGLSLWISKDRPAIESGDLLKITIRKRDLSRHPG